MQTNRQKILAALAEKPLTTFNIMKRVNIKSQDECQTLLLKMRDEGAVKFDIHKGVWNIGIWQTNSAMRPIAAGEDLPTIVQWVRGRGGYIISPAKCLS